MWALLSSVGRCTPVGTLSSLCHAVREGPLEGSVIRSAVRTTQGWRAAAFILYERNAVSWGAIAYVTLELWRAEAHCSMLRRVCQGASCALRTLRIAVNFGLGAQVCGGLRRTCVKQSVSGRCIPRMLQHWGDLCIPEKGDVHAQPSTPPKGRGDIWVACFSVCA